MIGVHMKIDQSLLKRQDYYEIHELIYDIKAEQENMKDMIGRYIAQSSSMNQNHNLRLQAQLKRVSIALYVLSIVSFSVISSLLLYIFFSE